MAKQINWLMLQSKKDKGEKITALTAYDASFSYYLNEAGIEVLLVGDSLGMAIQGNQNTLNVSVDSLAYHTRCVSSHNSHALLMTDMPFMAAATRERAFLNAEQLIKAGANMLKIEGGEHFAPIVAELTACGIAVCSHIGLGMQFSSVQGGVRVQGRDVEGAEQLKRDAKALEQAGAKLCILECVPAPLAQEICQQLRIPVIGIGSGVACDGQILVTYDLLGLTPHLSLRFTKNFLLESGGSIQQAFQAYAKAVKEGQFPSEEHSFL